MVTELIKNLEQRLADLDAEAREGIDDACWLYERTEAVAKEAIAELKQLKRRAPKTALEVNPDHDSLFLKFEQLQRLLSGASGEDRSDSDAIHDAQKLVTLIRAQVLK